MKVIIDIPKYVYDTIVAGDSYIPDCDNEKVGDAIKNGTLLQKDMGIDAELLKHEIERWKNSLHSYCDSLEAAIDEITPIIIEADNDVDN